VSITTMSRARGTTPLNPRGVQGTPEGHKE
jgi:hypothetical protein